MPTEQSTPLSPQENFPPLQPVTNDQSNFYVAVFGIPDERESLLPVLETTLGRNRIDARTLLRRLPGLLFDHFDKHQAAQAVRELQQAGVEAAAIAKTDIPDLRHARTLHHVRCHPLGLVILDVEGHVEETVSWGQVVLLSIADVPLETGYVGSHLPDGVFHHRFGIAETELEPPEHSLEMWLVCETPFRAFHIDHELMNYEYLAERRSTSAILNFSELVKDIREQVPSLFLTRSARAFIEHGSAEDYRFPSPTVHRDFVQFQILLMRQTKK